MNDEFVKLELEPEFDFAHAFDFGIMPKKTRPKVCAGVECIGKHRGRCKAKNSPWRKQPKAETSNA